MAEELKPFKREDRYIVIKRKDLAALADKGELRPASLDGLMDLCADLPAREYVVIESDWPEYPIVWQMIKARMNGSAQQHSQGGEAVEVVAWQYEGKDGKWWPLDGRFVQQAIDAGAQVRPLYTHPADQVAEGVVVSRELLDRLCHGPETLEGIARIQSARAELRAMLAKSEGVKK